MKVLMLGWELPPHNSGGLGVACLNLSRALARDGAEIDFIVPYTADHPNIDFMNIIPALGIAPLYRYGWGAYDSRNIENNILPASASDAGDPGFISMRDVQQRYSEFVQQYLVSHRPDVVHAHDWLTLEAGILAKKNFDIPLVVHMHATEYDRSGMAGGNQLVHEIEREGMMLADKVIAVSEATRQLIHDKYNIPINKITVAYNALDEDFSHNHHPIPAFPYFDRLKKDGYTIVSTVGRFTIQKGLWHLLHAAAMALRKNPKLMFIFAGDGEERNELISAAADFGISEHIIFTGFIRGDRLRDIYAISDIFVMSSISEPFGLTALEAAHYGNVLILTKQSGVAEIIPSALTYDFWDDNKLATQLVSVSTSPELYASLRSRIFSEYNRISWQDAARVCLKSYYNARRKTAHAR